MPQNAATPSGPSGEGAPKPSRIGGFELLATLGKGGMGTVFKARQVSMDRVVALKVLPPNLAKNQGFVQRFLREARSAAQLNHPNIVQGIDVGEADGLYYFAMEFVDGPTLKGLLKREGRLDEKRALAIVGGVARALDHAHKHAIVHRDIKPDNIMISRDGAVKLADLGLARSFLPDPSLPKASSLREAATEASGYRDTVTLDGTALGTPHYMAPEQARGDADIDTRADIYALGATLFHAVTGEFPYAAPNAGALMAKHITEPVPNPKDRNPALSRPICDLIQHMMAKDREDRPHTPADLLAEIRDALEGKIKLHRPSPLPTRSSPLPPGEGRVRAASSHLAAGRRASPLPWMIAAALVLAAGALFLVLRPGKAAGPQAKSKDDQAARAAKDARQPETAATQPEAKTEPEAEVEKEMAALSSRCDDLVGKGQFGPALAAADAFAKAHPDSSLPKVSDLREGIAGLRSSILAKADERYAALVQAADAAIEKKDFPSARAALKPVDSFGIPDLADRAKKKLEEIASREKGAEAWAKWDGIKADAKKLIDAAKLDDAAKLIEGAKALPLDGIADLTAEQMKSIESARSAQLKAALAAYAAESDRVWALFKDRKYTEGDKLLADLAASLPKAPGLREGIAGPLAADQGAAKLIKDFWAAVERGLAAKAGQFVSFKGAAGGTLVAVQGSTATVKTPKGEEARQVHDLVAKQAIAHADLKDDPHSHLIKGVFLLAEGQDAEAIDRAFAAAGDAPGLSFYTDRLDRALGREKAVAEAKDAEGREAAARSAWRALLAASKGDLTQPQAKRALASFESFEAKYANTQLAESVRDDLTALRARIEEKAEGDAAKPAIEPTADDLEQGLLAVYYAGREMDKFVAAKPLTGDLSINWAFNGPLPDMPVDDFSGRFVGWLRIDRTGTYLLRLAHDDGGRLYLDGKKVIDGWHEGTETTGCTALLAKGYHRLWVEHFEGAGISSLTLSWLEKGEPVPIPADRFFCERKLLDAARATPNRNPLLRMGPTDRVRPPEFEPAAEPGLIAWWPGDTGGGKLVRDLSANRLHGQIVGSVRQARGRTGLALSFQGGYVQAPDTPLLDFRESLTLMAWARPDKMGEMRLLNKTVVGKNSAFVLDILADNSVRLITRFGALKTADTLPLGKWTHVAATFDTAVRRIYLNGELKADGPSGGPLNSTPLALRLGADNEGTTEFHGLLGDIRVFSRALDTDTIRRLAGIKSP